MHGNLIYEENHYAPTIVMRYHPIFLLMGLCLMNLMKSLPYLSTSLILGSLVGIVGIRNRIQAVNTGNPKKIRSLCGLGIVVTGYIYLWFLVLEHYGIMQSGVVLVLVTGWSRSLIQYGHFPNAVWSTSTMLLCMGGMVCLGYNSTHKEVPWLAKWIELGGIVGLNLMLTNLIASVRWFRHTSILQQSSSMEMTLVMGVATLASVPLGIWEYMYLMEPISWMHYIALAFPVGIGFVGLSMIPVNKIQLEASMVMMSGVVTGFMSWYLGEGTIGVNSVAYALIGAGSSMTQGATQQFWHKVKDIFQHLMEEEDSRKILIFLIFNISFMFVEILVGIYTNSLGLISDAGHMFFDNGALLIGLAASYIAKWKPDDAYTYGYGRYEVLSGFINSLLLVFIAFSVCKEAFERFFDPPTVHTDHLLSTSVIGFLVNLVGLVCFHDFSHGGGCSGHGHSHGHSHEESNDNMYGVYLHVLADTLGSVGVILSSLLIEYKQWYISDPICSIFISILILGSSLPLIKQTAFQLVQRVPLEAEGKLKRCVDTLRTNYPQIVKIEKVHFWKHCAKVTVGTLHLVVQSEPSHDQQLQHEVVKLFETEAGITHMTVQVDKTDMATTFAPFIPINTPPSQQMVSENPPCSHGHLHH